MNIGIPDIKRELLTYLADLPRQLRDKGRVATPELVLSLGKCLSWLAPSLDGGTPQPLQPISQTPQNIESLGKQFWDIGIALYDQQKLEEAEQFREDLQRLKAEVCRLSEVSSHLPHSKLGGAK